MFAELEVSEKLKYLRNQFADEIRKLRTCKSGMSADGRYVTKWKYFQRLSLLSNHVNITPGRLTTNLLLQVSIDVQ